VLTVTAEHINTETQTSSQSAYWRSLMRENPQLNTLPHFKNTTWVGFAPSWPPASCNHWQHVTSNHHPRKAISITAGWHRFL